MKWKVQKMIKGSDLTNSQWEDINIHDDRSVALRERLNLYLKERKTSNSIYRVVGSGKINILQIYDSTMADGIGLRTSVYFAGCHHQCPGCHNKESWDFKAGREMDIEELAEQLIHSEDKGITFSGGDPIYNIDVVIELARGIKGKTDKTIWLYTGFTYDYIKKRMPEAEELFEYIDFIVDGPFLSNMKDSNIRFRGSSNQHIIRFDGKDVTNQIDSNPMITEEELLTI